MPGADTCVRLAAALAPALGEPDITARESLTMRPDSILLVTLARVRNRLLEPTTANLEACSADLEWSIGELRRAEDSPLSASVVPQIKALLRQIHALHRQAGELRLGAARLDPANTGSYTADGLPSAGQSVPHLAISG